MGARAGTSRGAVPHTCGGAIAEVKLEEGSGFGGVSVVGERRRGGGAPTRCVCAPPPLVRSTPTGGRGRGGCGGAAGGIDGDDQGEHHGASQGW
eukprot:COSAG03_NODE_34_length_17821_cov_18.833531_19_plen_94_part_00